MLDGSELPARDAVRAMVAVCLAVHEPDPELLRRQLESLRAQTCRDWVLVREDDPAGDGPYRVFERCLARVPRGADLVALSDQDDVWHPDKLAALIAALAPGVTLAFSDLRIVAPDGRVRSPTYWTNRDNGWSDLGDLLATNTVTGAASLLRREVLDVALPFPPRVEGSFHDHWLALCALALGDLAYVDRPLVDYVQHERNVVGHAERRRPGERSSAEPWRVRAARDRERHVLLPALMARTLLERCGDRMTPPKRRTAEAVARGDADLRAIAAIAVRAAREQARPRRTLEAQRRALRGALWGRGRMSSS